MDTPRGVDHFIACIREGASNDGTPQRAGTGQQYWRHLARLAPDPEDKHAKRWSAASDTPAVEYWYKDGTKFDDEVKALAPSPPRPPPPSPPRPPNRRRLFAVDPKRDPKRPAHGHQVTWLPPKGLPERGFPRGTMLRLFTHSAVDDYTFQINPTSGYIR